MVRQNATKSLSGDILGFPGAASPKNCTSHPFPVFLNMKNGGIFLMEPSLLFKHSNTNSKSKFPFLGVSKIVLPGLRLSP